MCQIWYINDLRQAQKRLVTRIMLSLATVANNYLFFLDQYQDLICTCQTTTVLNWVVLQHFGQLWQQILSFIAYVPSKFNPEYLVKKTIIFLSGLQLTKFYKLHINNSFKYFAINF